MKTIDIKELAKFTEQYVAISTKTTEIVASGKTIKDVDKKLKTDKITDVIIQYVAPLNKYLSPVCQ